jgi:hypothetical protein
MPCCVWGGQEQRPNNDVPPHYSPIVGPFSGCRILQTETILDVPCTTVRSALGDITTDTQMMLAGPAVSGLWVKGPTHWCCTPAAVRSLRGTEAHEWVDSSGGVPGSRIIWIRHARRLSCLHGKQHTQSSILLRSCVPSDVPAVWAARPRLVFVFPEGWSLRWIAIK